MGEPLALVEGASDLARVPEGRVVVPLTPAALLEAAPPILRPSDLVAEERLEELGAANFDRVESICARLDALYGEPGIEPALWHIFPLKILVDGVTTRALQVAEILRGREPSVVLQFESGSLYSAVLPLVAEALDAPLVTEPSAGQDTPATGSDLRRRLRHAVSGLRARARDRRAVGRRRAGSDAPSILCLDYEYNVPSIAREVERLGMQAIVWWGAGAYHRLGTFTSKRHDVSERVPLSQFEQLWRTASEDAELRELFVWDGVDLWAALESRLRPMVIEGFHDAVNRHGDARRLMEDVHPAAVLMSTPSQPAEKALCSAARELGIPTVIAPHGGFGVRHVRMDFYGDLDAVDWSLAWGRFEEAAWRTEDARQPVRTVAVGAPMIEEAAAGAPSRREARKRLGLDLDARIVLYVPTTLSGDLWYASNRTPTDVPHFEHQVKVMSELAAVEGWKLVVKGHPYTPNSVIERWCEANAPDALVVRRPGFESLVHLADAVVLDIPSTTVVQALFGSAHVYLVGYPSIRWSEGVVEHLAAHGIPVCNADDIASRLANASDSGQLARPAEYGSQAREAFVAGGPGTGAQRAAKALADIATGRDPRLTLRSATMADAGLLMDWRNEPDTLAVSGNTRPVTQEEHEMWLAGLVADDDRHLLIAEVGGTAVGQIRFERHGDAYEVSVSLASEARGRGLGSALIGAGVGWLSKRAPGQLVRAIAREDNARSLAAFGRAGFAPAGPPTDDGWLTLERTAHL